MGWWVYSKIRLICSRKEAKRIYEKYHTEDSHDKFPDSKKLIDDKKEIPKFEVDEKILDKFDLESFQLIEPHLKVLNTTTEVQSKDFDRNSSTFRTITFSSFPISSMLVLSKLEPKIKININLFTEQDTRVYLFLIANGKILNYKKFDDRSDGALSMRRIIDPGNNQYVKTPWGWSANEPIDKIPEDNMMEGIDYIQVKDGYIYKVSRHDEDDDEDDDEEDKSKKGNKKK